MVFPYLETAVSFALVMLVASLMVNVTVRILYTLRGQRAQGVSDMLLQLHRGFCDERGIVLTGAARKLAENAFLDDVLGSPILHDGRRWEKADVLRDQGFAKAEAKWKEAGASGDAAKKALFALPANDPKHKLALEAKQLEEDAEAARSKYLRTRLEYIKKGDLLAIIRVCSIDAKIDDARYLPITWFGGIPASDKPPTRAQQRQFAYHYTLPPGTINARDFHDYCLRWFPTVEENASQSFGNEQRTVARSVAGLAVVLLNLDAIHLAYDLYRNRAISDHLSSRVDEVLSLSKQIGAEKPGEPDTMSHAQQELSKAAAILTTEHVPLGWQDSYMAKRWCAYHDDCDDVTIKKPTTGELELDIALWILGLGTSWMLLSLGAPFWVSVIEKITGLGNLMTGGSADDHKGEERAWTVEGTGEQTLYDPAASSAGLPRAPATSGEIRLPPPPPAPDPAGGDSSG